MPAQPMPPRRPPRSEPRDVTELKLLKANQAELAEAVDLQLELLALQRRVQARVPLPWFDIQPARLEEHRVRRIPLLAYEQIPIDWTELRLMVRQTADILRRFQAIEPVDYEQLQTVVRTGSMLEPLVARWYRDVAASDQPRAGDAVPPVHVSTDALEQVLALATRPFLERCAESIAQRVDLSAWTEPSCPVCGGEAEFAVINPAAERLLICSRCSTRWRYDAIACPYCRNADRSRITSFTSRDGRYRLYACDACLRYLKAYDGRAAERPLMLAVDTIATLPLDAAAIKKGYRS